MEILTCLLISNFFIVLKLQILAPCGVNDFVCGRAAEWVSNGTDLCLAAGFRVKASDVVHMTSEETSCYGDKASLGSVADSWKASRSESIQKGERLMMFDDFQHWLKEMPFSERVSWAIGGMVLTAGLVFIRSECNPFSFLLLCSCTFLYALIRSILRKWKRQHNRNVILVYACLWPHWSCYTCLCFSSFFF